MSIECQKTVLNFLEALVKEKAIDIQWNDESMITAIVKDIHNWNLKHSIIAKCQKNPFSDEVENFQWESIRINDSPVQNVSHLSLLGLNEQQLSILQQNSDATDYLETVYEQCRTSLPKILESIVNIIGPSFTLDFDPKQPKAFAMLLASVPAREALIISEACGNIDGSAGNPLKNVIFGQKHNAIDYHPIPVAFKQGISQIHLVSYPEANIQQIGTIPERLLNTFKFFTDDRQIPMNQYAIDVSNKQFNIQSSIDAFVLLSKRSFIPVHGDYQIKTSFPAQITSENRIIYWNIAEDAIECGRIVSLLASMKKLPECLGITNIVCCASQRR